MKLLKHNEKRYTSMHVSVEISKLQPVFSNGNAYKLYALSQT